MTSVAALAGLLLQMAQNPSPMSDTTRAHGRVVERSVAGRVHGRAVTFGKTNAKSPVILHFHGAPWLVRQEAARRLKNVTVAAIQTGSGSRVYREAFATRKAFEALLAEAEAANRPVILTSFSAGYGAVRAILEHSAGRIDGVVLIDSLHAGYDTERKPASADLELFAAFGEKKPLVITHSEVYPGTYASTTETADWLIARAGARRKAVLRWGPGGMQQISEARRGNLRVLGFAGNSAPDHVDQLHGYATWLRHVKIKR